MNPLAVKDVLPRNGGRPFKVAKTMAWLFDRVVYPLGGKGYTKIGKVLIGPSANTVAVFHNGGRFVFPGGDSYYSRKLLTGRNYEEDMTFLLGNIYSKASPCFLDCGANFGYWSSAVSSQPGMANRVVSIEPSRHALPFLLDNQAENNRRFHIENLAIWNVAGHEVGFSTNRTHASSGIANEGSNYTVKTTTVDTMLEQIGWAGTQVLIKLDVEGAEVPAFKGAENAARAGSIFIYEDHGRDPKCHVTGFLLRSGWVIFFLASDHLERIQSPSQLSRLKVNRRFGYNLVSWRVETKLSTYLRSMASNTIGRRAA